MKRFLLLLVVALLAGCVKPAEKPVHATQPSIGGNVTAPQQPATNLTLPVGCAAVQELAGRDACYYQQAVAGDWEACRNITVNYLRDKCAYEKALKLNSSAECSAVLNASLKGECLMVFKRAACLEKDSFQGRVCLAVEEKNVSECAGNEECVFDYAREMRDASACSLVQEAFLAKACEAVALEDISKCRELALNVSADGCIEKAAFELDRWDYCNLASIYTYRDSCLQEIALAHNSSDICLQSSIDQVKDECLYAVALQAKDLEACAKMSVDLVGYSRKRDMCFYYTVKEIGQPAGCARIKDDYFRNWLCYVNLIESGQYSLHPTYCENIIDRDSEWRDNCYFRVVKDKIGDKSLCNSILDEKIRIQCFAG